VAVRRKAQGRRGTAPARKGGGRRTSPRRRRAAAPACAAPAAAVTREAGGAPEKLRVDRIEQEIACAAFFDPADSLDPATGAMLPLHQWPEHARRALAGFEEEALFETVDTGERGPRGGVVKSRVQVGVIRKVKWQDKTAAQRLGLQRMGALVERHENVTPKEDEITDEEMELLAHYVHNVKARKPDAG
jgi:hypothetical protein